MLLAEESCVVMEKRFDAKYASFNYADLLGRLSGLSGGAELKSCYERGVTKRRECEVSDDGDVPASGCTQRVTTHPWTDGRIFARVQDGALGAEFAVDFGDEDDSFVYLLEVDNVDLAKPRVISFSSVRKPWDETGYEASDTDARGRYLIQAFRAAVKETQAVEKSKPSMHVL